MSACWNVLGVPISTSLSPAAARYATVPGGHPQGYTDCFDAFVADFYEAVVTGETPDGLPQFADGDLYMVVRTTGFSRWVAR